MVVYPFNKSKEYSFVLGLYTNCHVSVKMVQENTTCIYNGLSNLSGDPYFIILLFICLTDFWAINTPNIIINI